MCASEHTKQTTFFECTIQIETIQRIVHTTHRDGRKKKESEKSETLTFFASTVFFFVVAAHSRLGPVCTRKTLYALDPPCASHIELLENA